MIDVTDAVKALVDRAKAAAESSSTTQDNEGQALKFSQAACNVANAAQTLAATETQKHQWHGAE